jgi:hypothetical protein
LGQNACLPWRILHSVIHDRQKREELTEAAAVSWRSRETGILLFARSGFKSRSANLKRAG